MTRFTTFLDTFNLVLYRLFTEISGPRGPQVHTVSQQVISFHHENTLLLLMNIFMDNPGHKVLRKINFPLFCSTSLPKYRQNVSDVSAGYKRGVQTDRSNYKPISVLPPISKIFERLIGSQINVFVENKLSNLLSAFRKGYSTQDALLRVIESWRKCLDALGIIGLRLYHA